MKDVTPFWDFTRKNCRIKNQYVLAGIGEFFGTFILCLFAVGAGAQSLLQCISVEFRPGSTDCHYFFPLLGGVSGLMIAITLFGGISGAHINPAVTLGLAISGKVGWAKVPLYWFMQFLGGYLGSGLAYALYVGKFEKLFGGASVTDNPIVGGIFAPPPNEFIGIALTDQIIGTAILVMIIHSALDERNMKVPTFFYGVLFAATIAGINFAFGLNAGGVLNPARDIAARLMAITVGFKSKGVFTTIENDHYWLAPMFGPLIGGALGGTLYVLFIGGHVPDVEDSGNRKPDKNGGTYADWRNTEFVPMASPQSPRQQYQGAPPPPPMQKDPRRSQGQGQGGGYGVANNNVGYGRGQGQQPHYTGQQQQQVW